jgi:hypothetical protein
MEGSITTQVEHSFEWDRPDYDSQTAMSVSVEGTIASLQFGDDPDKVLLDATELEALRRLLSRAAKVIKK